MPKQSKIKKTNIKPKNPRMICVSNDMVENSGNNYMHYLDFTLYVYLKIKSYKNIYNNYPEQLIDFMNWTKKETLYNHLDNLKVMGYIEHKYDTYPKCEKLKIKILKQDLQSEYTRLKQTTIEIIINLTKKVLIEDRKYITNLSAMGIRLYYYYVKKYNINKGYAYPSINQIVNETKIIKRHVIKLNKIFEENKILYIEHGKWNKHENNQKRKYNNKYIPLLEVNKKFKKNKN